MNLATMFVEGDVVNPAVAVVLFTMSVASWVVIVWKSLLLRGSNRSMERTVAAFWQAPDMESALVQVQAMDKAQWVLPLVQAALQQPTGNLAASADKSQQLTRVLRDALHRILRRLQAGQVLLATVGSTAPFVGLLGTVWGIYHALTGMVGMGQVSIEKIAGPVGEALIMTAAGLMVAIPAVLAYNILGRLVVAIEADLEGFARDLRELFLDRP